MVVCINVEKYTVTSHKIKKEYFSYTHTYVHVPIWLKKQDEEIENGKQKLCHLRTNLCVLQQFVMEELKLLWNIKKESISFAFTSVVYWMSFYCRHKVKKNNTFIVEIDKNLPRKTIFCCLWFLFMSENNHMKSLF